MRCARDACQSLFGFSVRLCEGLSFEVAVLIRRLGWSALSPFSDCGAPHEGQ